MMFVAFDTNHDGTIDFTEFVIGMAMRFKKDLDTRLNFIFTM